MSQSIGESILKAHLKSGTIASNEVISIKADLMLCDDYAMYRIVDFFEKMNGKNPFDKDKILVTCEHFTPPSTLESAFLQHETRDISRKWNLKHFYDLGRSGIGPLVAIANGLVKPDMLIVGTNPVVVSLGGLGCYATSIGPGDMAALWRKGEIHLIIPLIIKINLSGKKSNTIDGIDIALAILRKFSDIDDYHNFEFYGIGTTELSLDDRLKLAMFASHGGANSAIVQPSANLLSLLNIPADKYISKSIPSKFDFEINLSELDSLLVLARENDKIVDLKSFDSVEIDIVIIGGGVSGTLGNLRELDRIFSGRKLNSKVHMLVYPGSSEIFKKAVTEGIIERLSDSGALICPPGKGAEGYGHKGMIAKNEAILTNNYVFDERMFGATGSDVFCASTLTCAASAIAGRIVHQSEVR